MCVVVFCCGTDGSDEERVLSDEVVVDFVGVFVSAPFTNSNNSTVCKQVLYGAQHGALSFGQSLVALPPTPPVPWTLFVFQMV